MSDAAFREAVEAMLDAIEGHDDVACCESDDGSHEWVLFPGTMKDFLRARVLALYAARPAEAGEEHTVVSWTEEELGVRIVGLIFDGTFHPGDRVRVSRCEEAK